MNSFIEITGGRELSGEVQVSGSKNAALPILMATLLTGQECIIKNVPNLEDVALTLHLLEQLGADASYDGSTIITKTDHLTGSEASYSLVKALRASFWVLGPLLARAGAARVALPGGDAIGTRPVDIHLSALSKMGADIKMKHGVVVASAPAGLRPANITFPFPSVGATHQILMAASLVPGVTRIKGAAKEPEVVALADFLALLGVAIEGAGTSEIVVEGKGDLSGATYSLIGDRIEAGTYLLAIAACGGRGVVSGFVPEHLGNLLTILEQMGAEVSVKEQSVMLTRQSELRAVTVQTEPFPGFATDLQAPLMAALCVANGQSIIEENIFEGRFGHVPELRRMGAKVVLRERTAIIDGVLGLSGAPVEGGDIRGAAALVIAGLVAEGRTQIHDIVHLRRGYELLENKFSSLGACITCRPEEVEDYQSVGC
ncbi:MAG: UDP-N-acetylglucosamine 1-carboxyvinyltransferase [Bdellovibrionales bacterium]|nr:UDP-N-acetylglucosamine 1-carboxyvinyltransferase [Bdellovibrionales bacterium]